MNRLHPSTLGELDAAVRKPAYDRAHLRAGIVHLGLGAFHRAHQAVYTEEAIARSGGDWGIIGVSLRSADVSHQLRAQDCLYSVLSENATGVELRVIGAVQDVLVASEGTSRIAAVIARQDIRVVMLTVTEKGYSLAADGLSLDREDATVKGDLKNPAQPRSTVGILALGLQQRMAESGAPITIISCDNLSSNSKVLRAVMVDYLQATFPAVLPWLETVVRFPCSMVDRIVPAMTDSGRERQAQLLGVRDEGAVATEPFAQWIIEDDFAAGRPDWERAGAQLVADIAPYENIKLRLLNATHSAIAYCGLLAGCETVDAVMADDTLSRFVKQLMREELMPALEVPLNFDLAAYGEQLLVRFSNPCLRHRCAQIAMDGSEKIRQRWLPALQAAKASPYLLKALSAWCFYILQTDIAIDDPRVDELVLVRESDAATDRRLIATLACARITNATVPGFMTLLIHIQQNIDTIARYGLRALLNK
jgi:fructuronate reductase